MRVNKPSNVDALETARRRVALLKVEVDGLQAENARLQERHGAPGNDATSLVEVNSQLVLYALHADEVAETASSEFDQLTHASQRDALTGLPNRALMLDRMESAIALARRRGSRVAVLFVDLDRFKQVNDTLGHAAGDEALRLAARQVVSVLRDSDTVSRHSGDEFLVLLPEVKESADAALAASKMLLAIAEPSPFGALQLSASIGIAIYPEDGGDAQTLIVRADAAMYRSKRRGPGGFAFHERATPRNEDGRSRRGAETRGYEATETEARAEALRRANEQVRTQALTAQELERNVTTQHRELIEFLSKTVAELRAHQATRPEQTGPDALVLARLQEAIERQLERQSLS